jgi:hypothetical protein
MNYAAAGTISNPEQQQTQPSPAPANAISGVGGGVPGYQYAQVLPPGQMQQFPSAMYSQQQPSPQPNQQLQPQQQFQQHNNFYQQSQFQPGYGFQQQSQQQQQQPYGSMQPHQQQPQQQQSFAPAQQQPYGMPQSSPPVNMMPQMQQQSYSHTSPVTGPYSLPTSAIYHQSSPNYVAQQHQQPPQPISVPVPAPPPQPLPRSMGASSSAPPSRNAVGRAIRPPYTDPVTQITYTVDNPEYEGFLTKQSSWLKVRIGIFVQNVLVRQLLLRCGLETKLLTLLRAVPTTGMASSLLYSAREQALFLQECNEWTARHDGLGYMHHGQVCRLKVRQTALVRD